MKLWVDDVRRAPEGYEWIKTVQDAKFYCLLCYHDGKLNIDEIHLDHDAGDFYQYGGDYDEIIKWLEERHYIDGWNIPTVFKFHSMNPVGVEKMMKICAVNGWEAKYEGIY